MIKKIALFIVIGLLLITAFTGCQSNDTKAEDQSADTKTESQLGDTKTESQSGDSNKFPKKQITVVVGFGAGGASDTITRVVAKAVEEKLKVPVIVTNKAGATGSVGLEYVKNAKADGYTIAYISVEGTMVKALGYSTISPEDFDFIGRAMVLPAAVTVNKKAPWNTIEEFIEYAKENPSKIKTGNSGTGSIWHVAAASIEDKTGVKLNHIPFEGAAPAVAALMGGHLDAVTVSPSEVLSGVEAGELKTLAICGNERSPLFPDVPTLKEKGIDVEIQAWGGFAVTKGTPEDVKMIIEQAFKEAIESDAVKKICEDRGMTHAYMNGNDLSQFANDQYKYFSDLIPKLGIK